jgi:hypothetical protein
VTEQPSEVEQAFVTAFVAAYRKERWLTGLRRPKTRRKLLGRLCHVDDWARGFRQEVRLTGKRDEQLAQLQARLRAKGAGAECHVLSERSDLDGQRLSLREALDLTADDGCALLICLPKRLALHLPESPAAPLILSKPA